jgi:hypothetical protein
MTDILHGKEVITPYGIYRLKDWGSKTDQDF